MSKGESTSRFSHGKKKEEERKVKRQGTKRHVIMVLDVVETTQP